MLLTVIWVCLIGLGAWFLISQVFAPALFGGRLFPALRSSPIREEVVKARDEVADLTDAVQVAQELKVLSARKVELEQALRDIETSNPKSDKGESTNA
jgi:hypothetical protein